MEEVWGWLNCYAVIEHSATVDFRDQVDLGIRAIREKSADHSIPRTFQFSCRNNSKSAVLLQAFVPTESRSSFVCLDSFFYDALVISPGSLSSTQVLVLSYRVIACLSRSSLS
jgi:hypothetical protein